MKTIRLKAALAWHSFLDSWACSTSSYSFLWLSVLALSKHGLFNTLTGKQFGLIVGKGLLDNVVSDYLWAKAVLLTMTTVASAGLSIQVPLAIIVDSLREIAPHPLDYVGAVAVLIGFTGLNFPSDILFQQLRSPY